jgi:cyclopropane fatty-acyl-phospholipid synthase-like methyltransferase
MTVSRSDIQDLYTRAANRYNAFSAVFQAQHGIQSLLEYSRVLRPGLRVLDAGCGYGLATFACLEALRRRNFGHSGIDAFDLTPSMLERFQRMLDARGITGVQLRQADVLALESLPASWTNYDLILSTSMLEYLSKQELPTALKGLRKRLADGGQLLVVITKKSPETKVLIEWLWRAER